MVFLFYGPNTFAARAKIQELITRYRQQSGDDFGLERFDGADAAAEDIVAAVTSMPFLASHRLVIVEDLLANKTAADKVIPALERVPDSTVAVFYEPRADKRTKLFKQLQERAQAAEFKELSPAQLSQWVRKTVAEAGGHIDTRTAQFLLSHVGHDQWRLYNEIQKLVVLHEDITTEAIRDMSEPTFQQTIFSLTEACSAGRGRTAVQLYRGLRANKAEPLYVLAMIGWQLRNLLIVKSAPTSNRQHIAKEARMSPFVVGRALAAARHADLHRLVHAYEAVAAADYKMKTGAVDDDALVEQVLLSVSANLRPARA